MPSWCACCFAVVVADWCLKLILGYVVVGYVKLVCVCCFAVVVDDWCLNLVIGYVVIG